MQPSGTQPVAPAPAPPARPPSRVPTLLLGMAIGAILVLGTVVGMAVASRQTAEARPTAIAQYRTPGPTARPAGQDAPLAARPALVGFVLDVNGDEITVKSRQGPVGRVVVGHNTEIRRGRQRVRLADIRQGDPIVALGRMNQQRTMQARIVVVDPPRPFRDRADPVPSASAQG